MEEERENETEKFEAEGLKAGEAGGGVGG